MAPSKSLQGQTRLRARAPKSGEKFANHALAYALRLAQLLDECASTPAAKYGLAEQLLSILGTEDADATPTFKEMKRLLAAATAPIPRRSGPVFANLRFLSHALRLSKIETSLMELAIVIAHNGALQDAFQRIEPPSRTSAMRKLAFIMNVDARCLLAATSHRATLLRLGILGAFAAKETLDTAVQIPPDVLLALTDEYENQHELLDAFVQSSKPTTLTVGDFAHLQEDLDWLSRYLGNAMRKQLSGVNVLLWGRTGTGKTEFARVLADAMHSRLFEVRYEDREGNPTDGAGRLRAYQLAQACFERSADSLILFDEASDVFIDTPSFLNSEEGYGKAWMNRVLESNPVPTVWIANSVDNIDPAYRRRFDYSVEFATQPRGVRRTIIRHQFSGLPLADETIQELAGIDAVTPGQIASAARAARTADVSSDRIAALVSRSIERSSALLEVRPASRDRVGSQAEIDLSLLNTDIDLTLLVERMVADPAVPVNLCLYGPSGSGKTAFAHHVGRQLQKQVLAQSAGDVLGAYLGETEKAIADMFRQAAKDHAVLFLDEADSLLAARARSHYVWEVSIVNELLVQMDAFNGIFICATNAIDVIDTAALRRVIKIGFGYLKGEQRLRMAHELLPHLAEADLAALGVALQPLARLTIGDFVSVKQRARLLGVGITPAGLIQQLREELSLKDALVSPAIGFASP